MRRVAGRLAVALVLVGAYPAVAQAPRREDAILGERLVEGLAVPGTLWVRNDRGAVVSFDLATGARHVLAENGVVDLALQGRRPLGLRSDNGGYLVVDLQTGRALSPRLMLSETPLALVVGRSPNVLTAGAIHQVEQGRWRDRDLSEPLRRAPQIQVETDRSGGIYIGYNRGEWGGGLQRVDPRTGRVQEVRRVDGDPCKGPLGRECDPVTGLARDVSRPDCMLASVGLSHFFAHGRILRVCDDRVEVVFSEAVPPPADPGALALPNTWPFFGLAATGDGWVAVSAGRLFRSTKGKVAGAPVPRLEPWRGLEMARIGRDLIVLRTDVNWGQSLSGYTPLLVPVSR